MSVSCLSTLFPSHIWNVLIRGPLAPPFSPPIKALEGLDSPGSIGSRAPPFSWAASTLRLYPSSGCTVFLDDPRGILGPLRLDKVQSENSSGPYIATPYPPAWPWPGYPWSRSSHNDCACHTIYSGTSWAIDSHFAEADQRARRDQLSIKCEAFAFTR